MLTLHTHIKCQNYILIDCTINVTHTYIHGEMLFLHITHTHTHTQKRLKHGESTEERIILSTLAPYSSLKTDDDARKLS